MILPRDKILHIALGCIAVACALGALFIHAWLGLGAWAIMELL